MGSLLLHLQVNIPQLCFDFVSKTETKSGTESLGSKLVEDRVAERVCGSTHNLILSSTQAPIDAKKGCGQ